MSTSPSPRFWREPLDARTIPQTRGTVHVIEERCKGCQYCVEFCPRDVLERSNRYNTKGYHLPDVKSPDECLACGLCELLCPEFAIYVRETKVQGVAHVG